MRLLLSEELWFLFIFIAINTSGLLSSQLCGCCSFRALLSVDIANVLVSNIRRVRSLFLCSCNSADQTIVYAEKAEAEASKDALMFNCAQR